ncbi:MAG: hypothetical protein AB2L14_22830 [Candidatus Xenobiia bacterium LiM19]
MGRFRYEAQTPEGYLRSGSIEACNEQQARAALSSKGYQVKGCYAVKAEEKTPPLVEIRLKNLYGKPHNDPPRKDSLESFIESQLAVSEASGRKNKTHPPLTSPVEEQESEKQYLTAFLDENLAPEINRKVNGGKCRTMFLDMIAGSARDASRNGIEKPDYKTMFLDSDLRNAVPEIEYYEKTISRVMYSEAQVLGRKMKAFLTRSPLRTAVLLLFVALCFISIIKGYCEGRMRPLPFCYKSSAISISGRVNGISDPSDLKLFFHFPEVPVDVERDLKDDKNVTFNKDGTFTTEVTFSSRKIPTHLYFQIRGKDVKNTPVTRTAIEGNTPVLRCTIPPAVLLPRKSTGEAAL